MPKRISGKRPLSRCYVCALLCCVFCAGPSTVNAAARGCTEAEAATFVHFAPTPKGWKVDECAIDGNYALVGFYNANSGVTGLFRKIRPRIWRRMSMGGGQITPTNLLTLVPNMKPAAAQNLYDVAARQANSH